YPQPTRSATYFGTAQITIDPAPSDCQTVPASLVPSGENATDGACCPPLMRQVWVLPEAISVTTTKLPNSFSRLSQPRSPKSRCLAYPCAIQAPSGETAVRDRGSLSPAGWTAKRAPRGSAAAPVAASHHDSRFVSKTPIVLPSAVNPKRGG